MFLSKFTQVSLSRGFSSRFRNLRSYCATSFIGLSPPTNGEEKKDVSVNENDTVALTIIKSGGKVFNVKGKIGHDLINTVSANGLQKEFNDFGFCAGNRWCTSCHILFETDDYKKLPEMSDTEYHYVTFLMDYVPGHSRLGCRIDLEKFMDGMVLRLPERLGPGWEDSD